MTGIREIKDFFMDKEFGTPFSIQNNEILIFLGFYQNDAGKDEGVLTCNPHTKNPKLIKHRFEKIKPQTTSFTPKFPPWEYSMFFPFLIK